MKFVYLFTLLVLLSSCSSIQIRKKTNTRIRNSSAPKTVNTKISTSTDPKTASTITSETYSAVVQSAKKYLGTPYRSGGTTANGMDCSGLVITSFKENGIDVPRVSRDQAAAGKSISMKNAKVGDLIFFNTSGKGISHVGIIERIENSEIFFIHSSSSKGVTVSSLENSYWKPRFVKIVRIN